jgi:hypothetical protein
MAPYGACPVAPFDADEVDANAIHAIDQRRKSS